MKLNGGPAIDWQPGLIRVRQRAVAGWAMLAFGLGLPGVVLAAKWRRLGADPLATLGRDLAATGTFERIALGFAALLLGALVVYGLVWLLWVRDLRVWPGEGRWQFDTGLVGFVTRLEGRTDKVETLQLHRNVRMGSGSPPEPLESFELRLALPGSREPLFLGEWQTRDETREEATRWQKVLTKARLEES